MATSFLTRLPTIPIPPPHATFASISAFTLLSLFCTSKLPHHPLLVIAWAGGSYYLNQTWLELKLNQITATVAKQVDEFLTREGACEDCRKNVLEKTPKELAKLLADLKKAKEKELAKKEKEFENKKKKIVAMIEEELTPEQRERVEKEFAALVGEVAAEREEFLAELMAGRDEADRPIVLAEFAVKMEAARERLRRRKEEREGVARNRRDAEGATDGGRD